MYLLRSSVRCFPVLLLYELPHSPAQRTLLPRILLALQPLDDALEVQGVSALPPHGGEIIA